MLVPSAVGEIAPRALRRVLLAAAACAAASVILSATVEAQGYTDTTDVTPPSLGRRGFTDSWYWGAKGGALRFGTETEGMVVEPSAGAEWLITKRRGALLVSIDQAFFDRTSAVYDAQAENNVRVIDLKDRRRYSATLLAFPIEHGTLRPYAGIGLALESIQSTKPVGEFVDAGQYYQVEDATYEGSSRTIALGMVGVQANFARAAIFLQMSASPAQRHSLFNRSGSQLLEAGIRYNLSTATER
jgi:hypothetical protein